MKPTAALAERPDPNRERLELLKRTFAPNSSDDEFNMFVTISERTGLDPASRQIYFTKRKQWNVHTEQYEWIGRTEATIDGLRVVAARSGEMDGQETFWCGPDGSWCDVWLDEEPPVAAKTVVYRKGCAHPFVGIAKYREYVQITPKTGKPNSIWSKMSANQTGKCSEAQALRKAFPERLSGIYTNDEMAQADNPAPVAREVSRPGSSVVERRPEEARVVGSIPAPATESEDNTPIPDSDERAPTEKPWFTIDKETGEELLAPGWHLVSHYQFNNGFHEATISNYDGAGGARKLSTRKDYGARLKVAQDKAMPVAIDVEFKDGRPYLKDVRLWEDVPL